MHKLPCQLAPIYGLRQVMKQLSGPVAKRSLVLISQLCRMFLSCSFGIFSSTCRKQPIVWRLLRFSRCHIFLVAVFSSPICFSFPGLFDPPKVARLSTASWIIKSQKSQTGHIEVSILKVLSCCDAVSYSYDTHQALAPWEPQRSIDYIEDGRHGLLYSSV